MAISKRKGGVLQEAFGAERGWLRAGLGLILGFFFVQDKT